MISQALIEFPEGEAHSMKSHKKYTLVIIFALLALLLGFLSAQKKDSVRRTSPQSMESDTHMLDRQEVLAAYGKMPLIFEPNLGQTDDSVQFVSRGQGFRLFLTDNGATLLLKDKGQPISKDKRQLRKGVEQTSVLEMELVGANRQARSCGIEQAESQSNYFAGNDPNKWQTGVPNFHKVSYQQIYPGVDLFYYGNGRQLEFDFIVAPGTDSSQIALEFKGADNLKIAQSGDLVLSIGGEQIVQKKPFVYQDIDGTRNEIQASYELLASDGQSPYQTVGFGIGDYDRTKPLVIDPVMVYSTYLGGVGWDAGNAIAVDSLGNTYVTGVTASDTFPTTPGAFQTTYGVGDAFVTKINAAGSALVYSTYIHSASGNGIAVDSSGNAYVTGESGPPGFPTTPGSFQTPQYDYDTFITKLNATGSALVYSSRFGSNFADYGRAIALDAAGNAYITGWTVCRAAGYCNFPTVNAFQPNYGGGYNDAFVTKMNSTGSALVYSTYLGGGQILNATDDWGEAIAVDSAGSAYVTGETYAPDFPLTPGAFDTSGGGLDAFVTKFSPDGASLVYSTLLGGAGHEQGMGIAVDANGNAYVTGLTYGYDFPITPGAFQTTGDFNAFVTKFNPQGSALVYSTYIGGSGEDRGWGISVDGAGNAYITGDTKSTDFPVVDAVQPNYGGGLIDAFASKLNPTGTALVYSTYLGGNGFDEGRGIAVDGSGSAYITGNTSAFDFPVTPGVFQIQNAGGLNNHDDAFVTKIQGQQVQPRRTLFDFDGDGKADVSVFRPSDSIWYLLRSQAGFTATQWGLSNDKLAPADFDGDGKTDIAVYRSGTWYLQRSSLGSAEVAFGNPLDIPQPADFDGDGKAELAVFRPSNGTWYVLNLVNNQFSVVQFGASTDRPVVGDYDGDGKADYAVYRDGTWYLQRSSLGFQSLAFGVSTDMPVPGDYDGDGKTDVAVFRPSTGTWYLQQSAAGFTGVRFGIATDLPEPADYDGDGKTDVTVFRNGTWYQLRSTQGFALVQFGVTNDKPIPNASAQ